MKDTSEKTPTINADPTVTRDGEISTELKNAIPAERPPTLGFGTTIALSVVTPDELLDLRVHVDHINRLFARAEEYLPARKLAEFKALQAECEREPSKDNLARRAAAKDPREMDQALLNKELWQATISGAKLYYVREALPILKRIYCRVHERWDAELEFQKAREEQWRLVWSEWAKWGTYYGASGIELTSVLPRIAQTAMEWHKALRDLDDHGSSYHRPPDIESKLHRAGITLPPSSPA